MKKISTLSHAKAVHAVKSIGKVLLPVALLLAAILCIGVCAGAEDAQYTYLGNNMHAVRNTDGTYNVAQCEFSGAACAEAWYCDCGNTQAHTPDESKHVESYIVAQQYVKSYASDKTGCLNCATLYTSCKNCGKTLSETFVPNKTDGVKNEGHIFVIDKTDNKDFLVNNPVCGTVKEYYKACVCSVSSKGITNETTASTVVWPHTPVHYNGESDADFKAKGWKLTVDDLKTSNVATCVGSGNYYDYCKDCGAVVKESQSYYAGGDGHSYVTYTKNGTYHWKYCKVCGYTDGIVEKHIYDTTAGANKCADVKCQVCGHVMSDAAHNLEYVAAKAATCDVAGNKAYYACKDCGKKFKSTNTKEDAYTDSSWSIAAKGHKKGENAPDCNPGKCTVCDQVIAASAAHEYEKTSANYITDADGNLTNVLRCDAKCSVCDTQKEKNHNVVTTKVAPTCTVDGYSESHCTVCGFVPENGEKTAIKATGHKASGAIDCYTASKCSVCGETISAQHTMPAALEIAIQSKNLNCTSSYRCTVCGVELVAKAQHEIQYITAKAATCTEKGVAAGWKCAAKIVINGATYECSAHNGAEEIAKLDHVLVLDKTIAATCVSAGTKVFKCTRVGCTYTEEVVIEKLDATNPQSHVLSTNYKYSDSKHWQYCTVPGCTYATEATAHTYSDNMTAATCVKDAVCTVCQYTQKATGHEETKWAQSTVDGKNYHWKQCTECKTEIEGTKAECVFNVFVPATDPTCGASGYSAHLECECGNMEAGVETTEPTGEHNWSDWERASQKVTKKSKIKNSGDKKNQYAYRYCKTCNQYEGHECNNGIEETCLENLKCSVCKLDRLNKNGKVITAADGHEFGDVGGMHDVKLKCTRCDVTVTAQYHDFGEQPACKDRNCIVEGCNYTVKATIDHAPAADSKPVGSASGHGYTCQYCNDAIANEDHKVDAWLDCTKELVCTVCGYVMKSANSSHDWVAVNAVPATCTTEGHTAYMKCKNCSVETAHEVVAKTAHAWEEKEGKLSTTTEVGYTPYKECSVCGAVEGKNEIPKLEEPAVDEPIKGDFNGDGKVTSDDAIALLKAIMFGGEANQPTDYNGDGKSDTADAIALLKAAMFG